MALTPLYRILNNSTRRLRMPSRDVMTGVV